MAIASTVKFINKSYTVDALGQRIPVESYEEIYADIKSVSQTEWYNAGKIGLQPAFVVITPAANYCCQEELIYCCKRYSIYRTYFRADGDLIELYLEEKAGS